MIQLIHSCLINPLYNRLAGIWHPAGKDDIIRKYPSMEKPKEEFSLFGYYYGIDLRYRQK